MYKGRFNNCLLAVVYLYLRERQNEFLVKWLKEHTQ